MRTMILTAAFAPLLLAFACGSAVAAPEVEATVRHVKTRDLDLATPEGRKLLDRRIAWAATEVCSPNAGASMTELMHSMTCRRKALRDVQTQVAALMTKTSGRETVLARADLH